MQATTKRGPALLLCALLIGFLPAFSAAQAAAPYPVPERIRVATLKGPTGIGMLNLLESRSLSLADGRKIELAIEVAAAPDIMDARVLAKQVDVVTLPVNQAARLYNLGTGLSLGGVNVWGVLYLLSSDPAAQSWAGLKGKTVYSTGKGATPDIVFRDLARRNGLDPDKDFTLDYRFGQVELAQLMIAGKVETACLPEPFVTRILLKQPGMKLVMDLQKEWAKAYPGVSMAQGGIALAADFAKRYPDLAREFLAAYAASTRLAGSAPDAPARVAAQDLGIDAASYQASLVRLNLSWQDAPAAKTAVETFLKAFLAFDSASVGGKLPDAGFYFK